MFCSPCSVKDILKPTAFTVKSLKSSTPNEERDASQLLCSNRLQCNRLGCCRSNIVGYRLSDWLGTGKQLLQHIWLRFMSFFTKLKKIMHKYIGRVFTIAEQIKSLGSFVFINVRPVTLIVFCVIAITFHNTLFLSTDLIRNSSRRKILV